MGYVEKNQISENIRCLNDEIQEISIRNKRDPNAVVLVAVTKQFPAEFAIAAFEAGLRHFGENRVADLISKKQILEALGIYPEWHMIGSLQRRKVRQLIGQTGLIHSADTMDILRELDRCSQQSHCVTDVLIQINASGEETKHGFTVNEFLNLSEQVACLVNLNIRGLMTMAPLTDNKKILHHVFDVMERLSLEIKKTGMFHEFNILSMGMSNDYRIALEHGATHIRIGTAIFGSR